MVPCVPVDLEDRIRKPEDEIAALPKVSPAAQNLIQLLKADISEYFRTGEKPTVCGRKTRRSSAGKRWLGYRFSRNPIYISFILLVLGLSVWLNDLWLVVTLVPAVGFIAVVVIPREEQFLERNFHDEYLSYKTTVRRRL